MPRNQRQSRLTESQFHLSSHFGKTQERQLIRERPQRVWTHDKPSFDEQMSAEKTSTRGSTSVLMFAEKGEDLSRMRCNQEAFPWKRKKVYYDERWLIKKFACQKCKLFKTHIKYFTCVCVCAEIKFNYSHQFYLDSNDRLFNWLQDN